MASSRNRTTPTERDADDLLESLTDEARRRDARAVLQVLQEASGERPVLWGTSIVGFGSRHYRYASGREGDVAAVGFSPRKAYTALYVTGDLDQYDDLVPRLGSCRSGQGCLQLRSVDDDDLAVLREIAVRSVRLAQGDATG